MKVQLDLTLEMLNVIDSALVHYHSLLVSERAKIGACISDALDNDDSSIADCHQKDLDYCINRIDYCEYALNALNHL